MTYLGHFLGGDYLDDEGRQPVPRGQGLLTPVAAIRLDLVQPGVRLAVRVQLCRGAHQ